MTFNIRNSKSLDGELSWQFRAERVCALIQKLQPDILCVQEAFRDQVDAIAGSLPKHSWFGVGRDDGKDEGEFVPIFCAPHLVRSGGDILNNSSSKFVFPKQFPRDLPRFADSPAPPTERGDEYCDTRSVNLMPNGDLNGVLSEGLIECGTFWLSTTPEVPGSRSWDSACTRICTWVELAGLRIYNCHLDHKSSEARLEGVKVILKHLRSREVPALLCGDFNANPASEPIQYLLLEGLNDLAEGTGDTFNGFMNPAVFERIDYVFGYKIEEASSVSVYGQELASDHWPVIVDLWEA